jgi:dTDP-4-amino-4,6-dideoxygalactose transaminase
LQASHEACTALSGGDPLQDYETAMAQSIGRRHAIAFAYARTGLAAILEASGLRPGEEVILSPLTCKVVPLALLSIGLKPAYADISRQTLNLDAAKVAERIGHATRAVLFQHTYGNTEGIEAVSEICKRRSLLLVEDCAQCLPDRRGAPARRSDAAIFSNNPRKPLPAGSGGLVATDNDLLADALREARDRLPQQGPIAALKWRSTVRLHDALVGPRSYWPLFSLARAFGSAYRDRDLQEDIASEIAGAAAGASAFHLRRGMAWLPRIDAMVAQRTMCTRAYAEALADQPELMPLGASPSSPLYFFPIVVEDKERLLRAAQKRLLELVSWPIRLPIYPVERESELPRYGYLPGSCPVAEDIAERLVGLPTDFGATQSRRDALVALIRVHLAASRPGKLRAAGARTR